MSEFNSAGAAVLTRLRDRREVQSDRLLGHLVSLNGMQALVATRLGGDVRQPWSVGHLITIVHGNARLVGVICELAAENHIWNDGVDNVAHVRIELTGEIIDDALGKPRFYRGVRSYPELGAIAHRIRSTDLAAIYAFTGKVGIEIGHLSQEQTIPAMISVDSLIARHFAVIGSTGVGKTTAVTMLIEKCLAQRENLRALIIDPHNEYSRNLGDQAHVLDSETLEIPFWMFRFEEMLDIIYAGRKAAPEEADALHEMIRAAKIRFAGLAGGDPSAAAGGLRRQRPGISSDANLNADTPAPYRMADAVRILDEWAGQLEKRFAVAHLRALKARLESLVRDPRFRFMFGNALVEDSMARVLAQIFRVPAGTKRITIVQLAGLPNEVVNSVVSILARLAFELAMWSGRGFEIVVICEEAHRYIPSDKSLGFGPARQAIGRIAKEGSKYGASLGVISQRPSELDTTVLSQCSTMFAMRLPNDADKAIVRAALAESSSSVVSFLSSIADREAIAFGEALPTPMRMKFAEVIRPQAGDVPGRGTAPFTPNDLYSVVARLRGEQVESLA